MKKLYIISVLFSAVTLGYAQKKVYKTHTQIIYNMDFKADSTISTKTNDVVALYIGDNQSIFQNEKKYKIDSIMYSQPRFQNTSSKPLFKVNHVIFKDLSKSLMMYSEIIENINFGYEENIPPMKWKLTSEKKNILSYDCYKAETIFGGRKFIAWYTKQIPIPDGPYKFSGLPGLILEVYDDKDNFHYKLLAIIKKEQNVTYNDDIEITEKKKLIDTKINLIKKITKKDVKVNPIERN